MIFNCAKRCLFEGVDFTLLITIPNNKHVQVIGAHRFRCTTSDKNFSLFEMEEYMQTALVLLCVFAALAFLLKRLRRAATTGSCGCSSSQSGCAGCSGIRSGSQSGSLSSPCSGCSADQSTGQAASRSTGQSS